MPEMMRKNEQDNKDGLTAQQEQLAKDRATRATTAVNATTKYTIAEPTEVTNGYYRDPDSGKVSRISKTEHPDGSVVYSQNGKVVVAKLVTSNGTIYKNTDNTWDYTKYDSEKFDKYDKNFNPVGYTMNVKRVGGKKAEKTKPTINDDGEISVTTEAWKERKRSDIRVSMPEGQIKPFNKLLTEEQRLEFRLSRQILNISKILRNADYKPEDISSISIIQALGGYTYIKITTKEGKPKIYEAGSSSLAYINATTRKTIENAEKQGNTIELMPVEKAGKPNENATTIGIKLNDEYMQFSTNPFANENKTMHEGIMP